ncbi:mechanosensitive ion channel [Phormidium sp. LEGE 05292]|uniref:mechanosensitive ion channel n=1 Tax=[Phormidium] sp. LEGE 05292 TaxID=767427 RepID=UPI00187E48EA|nr:mechanosensitive ion channel [Phormidium sp. LEGE 05292]MBE9225713.1 mechanosensitive ion channel [Phormidium sp. LEGE 05292]
MNNIWQSTAHLVVSVPTPPYPIVAQVTKTTNPVNETVDVVQRTTSNIGNFLPNLLGAIVILVVGWLLAIIIAWAVKKLLNRTSIDNRITAWVTGRPDAESLPVEKWISDVIFWIIFIFALVAFLQALQLTAVYEPLNNLLNQVFTFLPKLAGATILLAIAWVIATIVKLVVTRSLQAVRLDERLNQEVTDTNNQFSISETIGNTLYWFIFLLFLPSILSTLELEGTLQPVQRLLNDILSILPNIFAAILIGAAGWLVAQVVRRIVTNLLIAAGTDRLGTRVGINPSTTGQSLSWIIGTIVYVLILIPVAIAALNALRISAISIPAIAMLNDILSAIPRIFTAGIILAVAYAIGRFLADVVTSILTSIGFNNVFNWIGLPTPRQTRSRIIVSPSDIPADSPIPETIEEKTTSRTPSEIVGIIVLVGIMLLATVAAVEVLNFAALTAIVSGIVAIAGQILVGLVIFAIGLYLANLAFHLITSSGNQQALILGNAARIAIIILVSAMALQQMGIAADIVNLAFGLLLGAIAVATAIAFGLGSRDVAGEQVRDWLESFKRKKNEPPRM